MEVEQAPTVSGEGHTKSMSRRVVLGITTLAILGCAAGAVYWTRARNARIAQAASESADPEPLPPPAPYPSTATAPPNSSASAVEKKEETEADAGLPLRSGEILEYTANVASLTNVANLKLQVREHKPFLGKSAWHLQAFAHTENPLRMVFELDDQFDSYSDASTMTSLQYEMHLSERGQKVQSVQRMTATGSEPAAANVTETRVLPGTRDPLGMMQYLRNVDWAKAAEVRGPVYDGHTLYDVRAKLASPSEVVSVPAGNYKASKVEIKVFENGQEMKDAHFTLYISHNQARTPLLLEAVLPVATARVELLRAR
jgi:hypothetical protein